MYLLDTNAVIFVINERSPGVADRLDAALLEAQTILISTIVLHELEFGIAKSRRPDASRRALEQFLAIPHSVLGFGAPAARAAAHVRAFLQRTGRPIGAYDLLLAGQALAAGATLVTANTREFARVPGLKLEDWGA